MSLELIKELRELTGAGMSDVKKALDEAKGDKNLAIEILRKQGQKMAAKKSTRETREGVIAISQGEQKIAVVEVYCETDFVARNSDFISTVQSFADELLKSDPNSFTNTATDRLQKELVVKIGENLQLGRCEVFSGDILGYYLHSNKKVAAIAVLKTGTQDLAKAIAMHIAASAPKYLRPEDVPQDILAKEKEIYAEQLKSEGKPEAMLDKIMTGKVQKFYAEVCLLNQIYIKDDKKTIAQLLSDHKSDIVNFAYFSL